MDDLNPLQEDEGLAEMLGHSIPSSGAARSFLNQFHSEEKVKEALAAREPDAIACIPEENDALTW